MHNPSVLSHFCHHVLSISEPHLVPYFPDLCCSTDHHAPDFLSHNVRAPSKDGSFGLHLEPGVRDWAEPWHRIHRLEGFNDKSKSSQKLWLKLHTLSSYLQRRHAVVDTPSHPHRTLQRRQRESGPESK